MSLVHVGDDASLEAAWPALRRWAAAHGHVVTGPGREWYWGGASAGDAPRGAGVTEVQLPVRPAESDPGVAHDDGVGRGRRAVGRVRGSRGQRLRARGPALGVAFAMLLAGTGRRPAGAQPSAAAAGPVARTFELRPREGYARQFEDGYRRHLDWHAGAGERWAWGMWQVTNGERAGLDVDGTFGHAWADFDAAVDPAGDLADNAVNVEPFAVRGANQVWRLRPDLGGDAVAAALPVEGPGAPFVWRAEYRVRGGAEAAFAAAARQLRAAAGARPYAVYELVSGGERPTYVVWAPAATWAAAGAFADAAAAAERALAASAERVRAEVWRFRPDLSLCADPAARCHGTTAVPR